MTAFRTHWNVKPETALTVSALITLTFLLTHGNVKVTGYYGVTHINMQLNAGGIAAYRTEQGILTFTAPPGETAAGNVTFRNERENVDAITLTLEGELAEKNLAALSQTTFTLKPHERKQVEVTVKAPEDERTYTGRIRVDRTEET